MKSLNIIAVLLILLTASCKKNSPDVIQTSAINIINASIDAGSVKVNPGGGNTFKYYLATEQVSYGTGKWFPINMGERVVTVVRTADTTKNLFSRSINIQQSSYTLYLTGKFPDIDTMFRAETDLPRINPVEIKPDSAAYLRFVNLSPNSVPVNINIRSSATNEVTGLAYKGISGFKKYTVKSSTANYVFEVRNATTNALLTSYTFNPATNRFKTVAVIIRGLMGTTSGSSVFTTSLVTYY